MKWVIEEGALSTVGLDRCTKPSAPTVVRNVKSHLSPRKAALCTAENAIRNIDHQEHINQSKKVIGKRVTNLSIVF